MPTDQKRETRQDKTLAESFPASDPPASMSAGAVRAVPPEELMREEMADVPGAVDISRHFDDPEAAKLALEAVVRDGPADRAATELRAVANGVELHLAAPPDDVARLRQLLDAA